MRIQQDDKRTITCFSKAAEQQEEAAQFNLGLMHDFGEGMPQVKQEAFLVISRWLNKTLLKPNYATAMPTLKSWSSQAG